MATSDEQRAWRCFHCGEEFTETAAAQEHFGRSESADPACQIDVKRFREMEELLARWQAEDTDLHRQIYGLNADHAVALRREEELGYARGLKDGTAEAAQQAPQGRENRALLQRCRYEIASLHDIYHDEMTYVPKALARLIQDIDAALAANPQQSNGAVEKPTKEPDAAIGASQVPEGVANAERSAMQLCPNTNPQQIASETKECE